MLEWLKTLNPRRKRRITLAGGGDPPPRRVRVFWRILMAILVMAATMFLFPLNVRLDPLEYLEGSIADEEILAPFTFDVPKSPAEFEREQALAAEVIIPVFWRSDKQSEINQLVSGLDLVRHDLGNLQAFLESEEISLRQDAVHMLANPDTGRALLREIGSILTSSERAGLVADRDADFLLRRQNIRVISDTEDEILPVYQLHDMRQLRERGAARGRELFGEAGEVALREMLVSMAKANVAYDHQRTELERTVARHSVDPVLITIQKGERIVDAHERITSEHTAVLAAMEEAVSVDPASGGWRGLVFLLLGRGLLVATMMALIAFSLFFSRPKIWASLNTMTVLTTASLITLALAAVVSRSDTLHAYLIPVPFAAIIVTLLVEELVALMLVAWLSALIATVSGGGIAVMLVGFVGGAAAVYSVRGVSHRMEVYKAMLLTALAMTAAVLGVLFMGAVVPLQTLWHDILWAVGNAVLCTALAMSVLPVFEKVFDLITPISLLELSDLNRPIFKRMMIEANGTYHHSMVIGSLAEAAAERIGADPLLSRVGAYYHDIGKVAKSSYFGENMQRGGQNPHSRLTPTMSSLILESHVREGLELAQEIGLPGKVAAFIPEHQGTTLMQYFYNKATELDPDVDESDYRYPGPRPQSRETAIVMLADAAEATVRSMDDKSPNIIRAVLSRLIEMRMADDQLDESGLTVSDLSKIKEAFTHVLTGVHHGRVKYQWQTEGGEDQGVERVFHPELETGIGTTEISGQSIYETVRTTKGQKP